MSSPTDRKDERIRDMFASIAPRYDLLNSLLSFNQHRYWRRFAVRMCGLRPGDTALDVGAGTGDLAIELARAVCGRRLQSANGCTPRPSLDTRAGARTRDWTGPDAEQNNRSPRVAQRNERPTGGLVVGVDFCRPMLEIGEQKLNRLGIANVQLIEGNAERLPVPSNAFRAATTGFTLRNVANIEVALAEMTRAVMPGGRVVVLELAKPQGPVFRRIYDAYFHSILPLIGGAVSGSHRRPHADTLTTPVVGDGPDDGSRRAVDMGAGGAYDYLPASVASFVSREELRATMEKVGLSDVRVYDLTAGIVAVHVGTKP